MNDTILSISDTVNDLKELTDYAKYIVGVNEKDIHKLKKCIKKIKNEDYGEVIKKSLLEDGEIC